MNAAIQQKYSKSSSTLFKSQLATIMRFIHLFIISMRLHFFQIDKNKSGNGKSVNACLDVQFLAVFHICYGNWIITLMRL